MSWALSGTTATTATSPAIASAPGPGPRLPPAAGTAARAARAGLRWARDTHRPRSDVGQAFQPAGSADFPVRRNARLFRCRGVSSRSSGLTVPGTGRLESLPYKGWRRRIVLGTDSPRNRQARQPALRTQGQSALPHPPCPPLPMTLTAPAGSPPQWRRPTWGTPSRGHREDGCASLQPLRLDVAADPAAHGRRATPLQDLAKSLGPTTSPHHDRFLSAKTTDRLMRRPWATAHVPLASSPPQLPGHLAAHQHPSLEPLSPFCGDVLFIGHQADPPGQQNFRRRSDGDPTAVSALDFGPGRLASTPRLWPRSDRSPLSVPAPTSPPRSASSRTTSCRPRRPASWPKGIRSASST